MPQTADKFFEDAQFYSERAQAVGSVIPAAALCLRGNCEPVLGVI